MTTVALTSSPTTLDPGTAYELFIVNSGTSIAHVQINGGLLFDERLNVGQSIRVPTGGNAVTAYVRSGSGQVDVTATAANPQGSPAHESGQLTIADAKGTYLSVAAGSGLTQGAPASQGLLEGAGAPSNALGVDGQMYYDATNKVLYGPKAAGAWPGTGQSVGGESISIGGLQRGDSVPQPFAYQFSASSRTLTVAGRIYLIRYVPLKARSLTLAGLVVSTAATANDPVEVGLYSSDPTTLTRLATTGSQTGKLNAVGVKTATLTYSVDPGTVYYVAITNATIGGTGASLFAASGTDIYAAEVFGATPPSVIFGTIDGVLSASALPATITAASVAWGHNSGQAVIPQVILREV